jgi:hypothetical protein
VRGAPIRERTLISPVGSIQFKNAMVVIKASSLHSLPSTPEGSLTPSLDCTYLQFSYLKIAQYHCPLGLGRRMLNDVLVVELYQQMPILHN